MQTLDFLQSDTHAMQRPLQIPASCFGNVLVHQPIATTENSTVYDASMRWSAGTGAVNDRLVLKVVPLLQLELAGEPLANFLKETNLARIMGRIGVGPPVVEHWICPVADPGAKQQQSFGFLLSEKKDISKRDYQRDYKPLWKAFKQVIGLMVTKKLRQMIIQTGYYHLDLHDGNVLLSLNQDKEPVDVFFIDFADAQHGSSLSDQQRTAYETTVLRTLGLT